MDILFITKMPSNTDGYSNNKKSGVYISASFLSSGLNLLGYTSKVIEAQDSNSIDSLVTEYNPRIVIIEAFWVPPEKFNELLLLHPDIIWVIRNHSALSYMSEEGIIIDWSLKYLRYKNVYLASNHLDTYENMKQIARYSFTAHEKIIYLPNYYPIDKIQKKSRPTFKNDGEVHIGCFGDNRTLKNQLVQAYASIRYAKEINRKLYFHINVTDESNSIVKSIKSLFDNIPNADLVEHTWLSHDDFYVLCGQMDIGLQMSFTETFNIVVADLVANNVPVVTSDEISWISTGYKTNPIDVSKIVKTMKNVTGINRILPVIGNNQNNLIDLSRENLQEWKSGLSQLN